MKKKNILDNASVVKEYNSIRDQYKKLGFNLVQAIELLLKENHIPYLSISSRVKDSNSFLKKIERKKYENPFTEIEDICGLRIICYYQSDVKRIRNLLVEELSIKEDINKVDNMEFDRFGYRSHHLIASIKKVWSKTPNYRGLEGLKAEIQVRTVLMHAWAEIEHKLAYKSESQIPEEYKRKLSRISAKLEESDEQFEEIRNKIDENKTQILSAANELKQFDRTLAFNLDNLQAFLDFAFPKRGKDIWETSDLFAEMNNLNFSLKNLVDGYEKAKGIFREMEMEENEYWRTPLDKGQFRWIQVGAARMILDLTNETYFNTRAADIPDQHDEMIMKYKSRLSNS